MTNMKTVHSVAHYQAGVDDDNTTGMRHVSMVSPTTRDWHQALDGFYSKSDPDLYKVIPPHDYNCRCISYWITKGYEERKDVNYRKLGDSETKLNKEFLKKDMTLQGHEEMMAGILKDKKKGK